mmetsp:Transcript_19608/g.16180  ORF Transcript_19608/g.16180 Transcript_19608/m.16180 type:complete len:137 (-) Transcript_19608:204-614(-)
MASLKRKYKAMEAKGVVENSFSWADDNGESDDFESNGNPVPETRLVSTLESYRRHMTEEQGARFDRAVRMLNGRNSTDTSFFQHTSSSEESTKLSATSSSASSKSNAKEAEEASVISKAADSKLQWGTCATCVHKD